MALSITAGDDSIGSNTSCESWCGSFAGVAFLFLPEGGLIAEVLLELDGATAGVLLFDDLA
jgi:hypothetical protein